MNTFNAQKVTSQDEKNQMIIKLNDKFKGYRDEIKEGDFVSFTYSGIERYGMPINPTISV